MRITKGKLLGTFGAAAVVGVGLSFFSGDTHDNDGVNLGDTWKDFISSEPEVETSHVNRAAYATTVRNPLNYEAQQFDTTSVIHESRVSVFMDDPKYDAVGHIVHISGIVCTANISTIEGYSSLNGGAIISSGHCFDKDGKENKKFDDQDYYPAHEFRFVTDYVDTDGNLQQFKSALGERKALHTDITDLAVATLVEDIPKGMILAHAIPDFQYQKNDLVSAAGFSADKAGLHVDIDCKITRVYSNGVYNTCDGHKGASGSALDINSDNTRLIYGAVRSYSERGSSNLTFHNLITAEFLDDVDFLQKEGVSEPKPSSRQCVKITADVLKLRDGPGTEFNVVGKAYKGDQKLELGRSGNWSVIKLEDNRSAYLHSGFAHRFPCSF